MHFLPYFLDDGPIHREFQAGQVHSYRIHAESDEAVSPLTYDFTFWTRCKKAPADSGTQQIEIQVKDLRERSGKMSVKKGRAGAGTLDYGPTGLPVTMRDSIASEAFWSPLLTFYLPADIKNGEFNSSEGLGAGAVLAGHGTEKDRSFDFDGHIDEASGQKIGVKLVWTVDESGWLVSGEGTVVDPSGTVTFKVQRQ